MQRFWKRVDDSAGADSCWPWTGYIDAEGYGHFGDLRAHRFACELGHGPPPAPGLHACHSTKCTTRACCNPSHLRWDTPAGNQADVAIVGSRRGERHPRARLTDQLARLIWARRAEGPTKVARDLGLPRAAVKHVIHGTNWSHVTGAVAS